MSNAYASALEISAKYIRENLGKPQVARMQIMHRRNFVRLQIIGQPENQYLQGLCTGFDAALMGMYRIHGIESDLNNG